MNIHEHQAKEILKEYGVPVSNGVVIFKLDKMIQYNCNLQHNDTNYYY